ncbi:unnamed protein product, partial [Discosporangium mesarthrocarpum]
VDTARKKGEEGAQRWSAGGRQSRCSGGCEMLVGDPKATTTVSQTSSSRHTCYPAPTTAPGSAQPSPELYPLVGSDTQTIGNLISRAPQSTATDPGAAPGSLGCPPGDNAGARGEGGGGSSGGSGGSSESDEREGNEIAEAVKTADVETVETLGIETVKSVDVKKLEMVGTARAASEEGSSSRLLGVFDDGEGASCGGGHGGGGATQHETGAGLGKGEGKSEATGGGGQADVMVATREPPHRPGATAAMAAMAETGSVAACSGGAGARTGAGAWGGAGAETGLVSNSEDGPGAVQSLNLGTQGLCGREGGIPRTVFFSSSEADRGEMARALKAVEGRGREDCEDEATEGRGVSEGAKQPPPCDLVSTGMLWAVETEVHPDAPVQGFDIMTGGTPAVVSVATGPVTSSSVTSCVGSGTTTADLMPTMVHTEAWGLPHPKPVVAPGCVRLGAAQVGGTVSPYVFDLSASPSPDDAILRQFWAAPMLSNSPGALSHPAAPPATLASESPSSTFSLQPGGSALRALVSTLGSSPRVMPGGNGRRSPPVPLPSLDDNKTLEDRYLNELIKAVRSRHRRYKGQFAAMPPQGAAVSTGLGAPRALPPALRGSLIAGCDSSSVLSTPGAAGASATSRPGAGGGGSGHNDEPAATGHHGSERGGSGPGLSGCIKSNSQKRDSFGVALGTTVPGVLGANLPSCSVAALATGQIKSPVFGAVVPHVLTADALSPSGAEQEKGQEQGQVQVQVQVQVQEQFPCSSMGMILSQDRAEPLLSGLGLAGVGADAAAGAGGGAGGGPEMEAGAG